MGRSSVRLNATGERASIFLIDEEAKGYSLPHAPGVRTTEIVRAFGGRLPPTLAATGDRIASLAGCIPASGPTTDPCAAPCMPRDGGRSAHFARGLTPTPIRHAQSGILPALSDDGACPRPAATTISLLQMHRDHRLVIRRGMAGEGIHRLADAIDRPGRGVLRMVQQQAVESFNAEEFSRR